MSIQHLESRLVRLMDDVQSNRREHNTLRSEVLLAMNQLCSAELLLGIWQTLEDVGARQEMMLVRLLRDLESSRLDSACKQLLGSRDPEVRSIGYAVVSLRSRRRGAELIRTAFDREAGIVLKRGGRRHLAPYSFITCMLAGIREFKVKALDVLAMKALSDFARGKNDLDLILGLVDDERPEVARLGFVTLASRFMGRTHQHVYERVIGRSPGSLNTRQRKWMQRAVERTPEVVEAIAEPGPVGLADAEFIRARIAVLEELGHDVLAPLVTTLIKVERELTSVSIERRIDDEGITDFEALNRERSRGIGFLLSFMTGQRSGLADFIDGFDEGGELETAVATRVMELSGPEGALNPTAALIAHWHELTPDDPDEGPFWRWIDGAWRDDRHDIIGDAIDAALSRPDETAIYASRVLATVGDDQGRVLRAIREGELVDLSELQPLVGEGRFVAGLRATLLDRDVDCHPGTVLAAARCGLKGIIPSLKARARTAEGQLLHAVKTAAAILDAESAAEQHPLYTALCRCALQPRDRQVASGEMALRELDSNHPARPLLRRKAEASLLSVYFWLPKATLPNPVGSRPASGYAARAEFLIDEGRVALGLWRERDGELQERLHLPDRPQEYGSAFMDVPWDTPLEALEEAIVGANGEVLATVPLGGSSPRTRTLAHINGFQVRLDTDSLGRFYRAVMPIDFSILDSAINATSARYGRPTFRTDSSAIWRYDGLEIGIRPDPAFDTLAEYVRVVRE